MERGSLLVAPENCNLKQQWHATTHLLEMRKTWKLKIPNADKDGEQQELSFIASWVQNNTANLGDSFIQSHRVLTCDPAITLLGISPTELNTYIHAKTCTWVLIKALFITVTVEATKMASGQRNCAPSLRRNIIQIFSFLKKALKSPKDVEEP